jgi:hypothetical protein|nr:hypothetical protein [Kofleriaceae bacterium]
MLARLQRGLEELYRLDASPGVDDFVIDEATRDAAAGAARRPREQLLVCEDGGELSVALFVDPAALANLAANDPSRRLGDHNFGDFLLAIEGVSHFVYALQCARADRPVTQLELELQAEVDKYVTCLLVCDGATAVSRVLRRRLFGDCAYEPDLDRDEASRYRAANDNAERYAAWLETAFVAPRRIPDMLGELRRFYRQGLAAKLAQIAAVL